MAKIKARVIIEMLGAPKEYIEQTLTNYLEKLRTDGIKIVNEVKEEAKKQGELFSTFAELDIEFEKIEDLFGFCFDSMPSSVEILEPEELKISAADFSNYLNDLQAKLHEVDMVVKTTRAQNAVLDKNAMNVFKNFIKFICKEKHTTEEMSKIVGIESKQLQKFVDILIKENKLKKEGDKYTKNE
ncbi:hypothetical protein KY346_02485 [Candidatus Woesearchaeota archaeon]|nr:hypothetical protein [Candidatus Woesearchaeota archaeon]